MKRIALSILMILFVVGMVSACGIKNAPKYVPEVDKSEKTKS